MRATSDIGEPATKAPNWVDKATLWLAVAGFLCTTVMSGITLSLNKNLNTIESKLNSTNAKVAEYQALGTIDYSYHVVDLRNYCGSDSDIENFHPNHLSTDNLYDSFIKNKSWHDAMDKLENTCDTSQEQIHPQNPNEYHLAYLEITPGGTQSFNPRISISMRRISKEDKRPIWEYESRPGTTETIPATLLRKDGELKLPIALLAGNKSASDQVLVPVEASWKTPITGEIVKLPLTFIIDQNHWRSIRSGHTLSGA